MNFEENSWIQIHRSFDYEDRSFGSEDNRSFQNGNLDLGDISIYVRKESQGNQRVLRETSVGNRLHSSHDNSWFGVWRLGAAA